jgi:hypothetical protein
LEEAQNMTSPFKGWTFPALRRVVPKLIAQEIVGVQPMSAAPISDIFRTFPIFSKYATNSDGVVFRFTPSMGKDEEKQLAIFKISFLDGQSYYTEVCNIVVDITGMSEDLGKTYVEAGMKELVDQIEELSIAESFNKNQAARILEEQKYEIQCKSQQNQEET